MKRTFLTLGLLLSLCTTLPAQEVIRLWKGTEVKARSVTLTKYLPMDSVSSRPAVPAVIVCPGGSYSWHDRKNEGTLVAEWLRGQGIAAFVLNYRVQGVAAFVTHYRLLFRGRRHPDALQDLQGAVRYVRAHAAAWGIDSCQVGVMGFSAGGHLAVTGAEFTPDPLARPDFVAAIYPVVTMNPPYVHKRSRRALLGEWGKRRQTLRDSLSVERHVAADCPPVFLVACKDDPVVRYENSLLLDSALTVRTVPHRYLLYGRGGHGFGASCEKGSEECRQWKEEFISWIASIKDNGKDKDYMRTFSPRCADFIGKKCGLLSFLTYVVNINNQRY